MQFVSSTFLPKWQWYHCRSQSRRNHSRSDWDGVLFCFCSILGFRFWTLTNKASDVLNFFSFIPQNEPECHEVSLIEPDVITINSISLISCALPFWCSFAYLSRWREKKRNLIYPVFSSLASNGWRKTDSVEKLSLSRKASTPYHLSSLSPSTGSRVARVQPSHLNWGPKKCFKKIRSLSLPLLTLSGCKFQMWLLWVLASIFQSIVPRFHSLALSSQRK